MSVAESMGADDSPQVSTEDKVVLRLMALAFIEIRAAENLKAAQAIADAVHNAPGKLGSRPGSGADALATIRKRAERSGIGDYIDGLIAAARKSVSA